MNYTINQNNSEKIINLIVKVSEWSECKNNIETRNISIYDQNNNTYSFDVEKLNKDGIFITERAIKCSKEFVWKGNNYAILIVIILFIVCVFIKWCLSSDICRFNKKVKKTINRSDENIEINIHNKTRMPRDLTRRNSPDIDIL